MVMTHAHPAEVGVTVAVLIAELAELPEGLSTPVTAGLLIYDVLKAVGWSDGEIAAVGPAVTSLEVMGIGVVEGPRAH